MSINYRDTMSPQPPAMSALLGCIQQDATGTLYCNIMDGMRAIAENESTFPREKAVAKFFLLLGEGNSGQDHVMNFLTRAQIEGQSLTLKPHERHALSQSLSTFDKGDE